MVTVYTTSLTISHATFCIYEFRMIIELNGDYFLKRYHPVDLFYVEVSCSL
jgi:hypothetical protein